MFDVIIIGSGLAGLTVALSLPTGYRIAVVCKANLIETASDKAQGGIAAVLDESDSFAEHVDDTLIAGAGLCDEAVVKQIAQAGPAAIDWLLQQKVAFSLDGKQQLHLTREGGHSKRRIVHAADITGHAVTSILQQHLTGRPNITILEHHVAVDLLTTIDNVGKKSCSGVKLLSQKQQQLTEYFAKTVVLACGGVGQLYDKTTNPSVATGDGVAMAWRAGCYISNLEFIQFHPTALSIAGAPAFLISEAVRGEGGLLLRDDGSRFMFDYDSRAELAPRDIVARAIAQEAQLSSNNCVYLDISHKGADFVHQHFPNIAATCSQYGIDISRQGIPVAPAAHYSCGGVFTGVDGKTNVVGLYAIGETAATGLHGANRLASNSLLECIVMAKAATADILNNGRDNWSAPVSRLATKQIKVVANSISLPEKQLIKSSEIIDVRQQLNKLLAHHASIVRTNEGLQQALEQVISWREQLPNIEDVKLNTSWIELRNLLDVAYLLLQSAQSRQESRGLHYNLDYPNLLNKALNIMLV